jgi:hypothetical protein
MEGQQVSEPRAYKRSPASSNSSWYKGILASQSTTITTTPSDHAEGP